LDTAKEKVEALLNACRRPGRILVLLQDNPDPDALACAAALRDIIHHRLRKRAVIGYGGLCGRAENRAMMRVLHIDARRLSTAQVNPFQTLCLVDTQPRSGNNLLTSLRPAQVVIDHHPAPRRRPWIAEFSDIRPEYGATSTILYEYVVASGIPLTPELATALLYGIESDTQDLGRECMSADIRAYRDLFLVADKKKLSMIRHAPVPLDYFQVLADSLAGCVVAGKTVISFIPYCRNPDVFAEVADRLMRLEGMRSAICYGVCENMIYLSARAGDARGNAAGRMKRVVRGLGTGGGHRTMAGGQVPVDGDPGRRLAMVRERVMKVFARQSPPLHLSTLRQGWNAGQGASLKQKGPR